MVGLSNLLLDIYDETIPPEPLEYLSSPEFFSASSSRVSQLVLAARSDLPHTPATATTASLPPLSRSQTATSHRPTTSNSSLLPSAKPQPTTSSNDNSDEPPVTSSPEDPAPDLLDRLAARDRAYHLLSTLTKLGTGWDYSEAWFSLARAYELSGQVEKAKEVLLWCVELEDSRPLRGWRVVGMRGFDI
jgi:cargo-transport protein YPP1